MDQLQSSREGQRPLEEGSCSGHCTQEVKKGGAGRELDLGPHPRDCLFLQAPPFPIGPASSQGPTSSPQTTPLPNRPHLLPSGHTSSQQDPPPPLRPCLFPIGPTSSHQATPLPNRSHLPRDPGILPFPNQSKASLSTGHQALPQQGSPQKSAAVNRISVNYKTMP